jgi:hypothetical protein
VASHAEVGINDGVLMSSRDGLRFERWVEAFLRPGPDQFSWTDRNNYIAWGLAPTSDYEISLYWSEHYRYPTYRLRRGTVRTDGFASVNAGAGGGEVLTRPFTFAGGRGDPHDGFAMVDSERLYGDEIAHTVSWQGGSDVSALAGRPVRLRIRLKDADMYSFQFVD